MTSGGSMAAWFILILIPSTSCALITVRVSVAGNDDSAIKVVESQSVSMRCTAVNLPAGVTVQRYHWMHMNQAISDANGDSLVILTLSYMNDLGDYQCGITVSTGERYNSNIIALKAKFAAIFPANGRRTVFVRNNETAILECTVIVPADDQSAQISWSRVLDSGRMPISDFAFGNSVLSLQSIGLEDAGEYRCAVITQQSGQGSADIRLIVVTKPKLSPQDTTSNVLVGSSHDIMCATLDTESAINFTWHINGEPLESNPKLSVSSESKSSHLHLTNVMYADAGRYTCTVRNIAGSAQQTTNIVVRGPPQITLSERLSLLTVPVSMEILILNCPFLANPPATVVKWTKTGEKIISEDEKYRIHNTTLEISRLTLSDSRNYSCVVTNDLGTDEATYTLLVIDYPRQPHDLAVAFDPDSSRSAVLTWVSPPQEANKPVTQYLLISQQQEGSSSTEFEISGNSTSFELTDLLPGENYEMTLQAINLAGIGATTIEFTQPVSAPSLTFEVFPENDGYSLFTRWQLQYDGGPSVSKFNIEVYENNNSQVYTVNPDLSEGNYLLTDLQPTTDYVLAICISNGVMENNMQFFIKTAIAPPSRPSTPRITTTTTHILKMTFTVRIGSRPVTHFLLNTTQLLGNGGSSKIQQEIAVDDSLYVDSVLALEEEGEWQVVLVVGGLQQLTYYSFQVAAVSAVGEGEYSAPSKPSALEDGRILYYIVFGVVGGATIIIIFTMVFAVVTLRTTRRIQRTKRTISINGSASQRGIAESFLNHSAERRSSNHSLQISSLNGLHDCTSPLGTPLSSDSDYKHHMISSSPNGIAPLYDRLSEYRKESVAGEYDKHAESVSSDGHADQVHQVHKVQGVPMYQVPLGVMVHHGIPQSVTVEMYASDGRIDSVVGHDLVDNNNGASAQNTTTGMLSSAGKVQSTHSLFQQSAVQHLPSSLHHLPTIQQRHLLCPPRLSSMTGSSPAINYRSSCDSILDKPTSYMTDV